MRSYIQFVTTPTFDTPGTTLVLHFDNKRYIIGHVAEGTQRAFLERGVKLLKTSDIFVTGPAQWATAGGLIGMILTIADTVQTAKIAIAADAAMKATRMAAQELAAQKLAAQKRAASRKPVTQPTESSDHSSSRYVGSTAEPELDASLTLHGARNLAHLLATSRRFLYRKAMPVIVHEIEEASEKDAPDATKSSASRSLVEPAARDSLAKADEDCTPTWSDENISVWAMTISPEGLAETSSASNLTHPRKRAFEEIEDAHSSFTMAESSNSTNGQKNKDNQTRKDVLSFMFASDWSPDEYVEMRLSEVPSDATAYVRRQDTGDIEKYSGPPPQKASSFNSQSEHSDPQVLVRKPWPGAMVETLPPTTPELRSMSYIFKNHYQRGKFLPDKAKVLKVEKRLWRHLTNGKNVTSMDGSTVTPEMVLDEGRTGTGVAVVDLPSASYVRNLVSRKEWSTSKVMDGIRTVVWILGRGVGQNKDLLRFVRDMSHLKHIVSSPDHCPNYLALEAAATSAIRLHQLDPVHFPVPVYDNTPPLLLEPESSSAARESLALFEPARRGLAIKLEPKSMIDDSTAVPFLDTEQVRKEVPSSVIKLATTASERVAQSKAMGQSSQKKQASPGKDAEVVTLGTGSMLPSRYRNVSATLLRVPGCGTYLFDCGENTLGQLKRVFPPNELSEVLRDLKAIWISHPHADHHLGTISVIKAWYDEVWLGEFRAGVEGPLGDSTAGSAPDSLEKNRLALISHSFMPLWLKEYSSMENCGYEKIVPLTITSNNSASELSSKLLRNIEPGSLIEYSSL